MLKIQSAFLTAMIFALVTISCHQTDQNNAAYNKIIKDDNYKVGDCFEFKEKIKDFGVIFLEEKVYPDGRQYNFFPVKLDTAKKGLDKFKYGTVYITDFPNFTKSSGRTNGLMVYHFLSQKDFATIKKFFSYSGTIQIREEYKNVTGGTVASNLNEFRTQLDLWDKMFGDNGRIASVTEIIR